MTGKPRRRAATLAVAALLLACLPAAAQTAGKLYVRPEGELYFPLDTYQGSPLYSSIGFGAGSALDFSLTSWLEPFVRGQYVSISYAGGSALQSTEGDLGLGLIARPTDRLSIRLDGMGGIAELNSSAGSGAAYAAGARLGLEYRISPPSPFRRTEATRPTSGPRRRYSRRSRRGSISATTCRRSEDSSPAYRWRT